MCATVIFEGREIETLGELRKIAPKIVWDKIYHRFGLDNVSDVCCLCPVDLPATAAANGFECQHDGTGEFRFERKGK